LENNRPKKIIKDSGGGQEEGFKIRTFAAVNCFLLALWEIIVCVCFLGAIPFLKVFFLFFGDLCGTIRVTTIDAKIRKCFLRVRGYNPAFVNACVFGSPNTYKWQWWREKKSIGGPRLIRHKALY
jgi:hypothetical protein